MFDTHTHTLPFSTDSAMTMDELINKQKEINIGIVLTEHMDFDLGGPDEYWFYPDTYFEKYLPFRDENILLGLEIGMQTHVVEENEEFVKKGPFDMIIGSIHAVNGLDLYEQEYFQNFDNKQDAYREYLQTNIKNVQMFDDFDTLGHIDYICRKAPYEDSELYYSDFSEEFDELFELIIQKQKSLELNTRRLYSEKAVKTLIPIYQRYYELGGRYITIGSDAHVSTAIAAYFEKALEIANICNLQPVYFKKREKIHCGE